MRHRRIENTRKLCSSDSYSKCFPMERTIIQGIKRLRVLTPYDYDNMDELVQDLSNALEETSCNRLSSLKSRKGRSWKRRSKNASTSYVAVSNSLPKSSAVSEDSESSLDDRLRFKTMDMLGNCSQPPSDSDEVTFTRQQQQQQQHFSSWRHCSLNLVESDSVNENFLPLRPQRRKRKFKRMAVDPQPLPTTSGTSDAAIFASPSQITRRVKSIRALKNRVRLCKISDIENVCRGQKDSFSFCGKRKRSMRERSLEYGGVEDRDECLMRASLLVSSSSAARSDGVVTMDCDDTKSHLEGSSSLSSSESDGGILTNDEGREADDEHSDFFYEPGPVCGVPGVVPWWDEAVKLDDSGEALDMEFQAILMGSFQHMSEAARQAYSANINSLTRREIRAGRRRLGNVSSSSHISPSVNENVVKSVQSSSTEWTPVASRADSSISHSAVGDTKRRRRTPPTGPVVQDDFIGEKAAEPISESNIGNRILRNMGWEPGTGLGITGQGIQTPIVATMNAKRQGLGYATTPKALSSSSSLSSSAAGVVKPMMQAPPPPAPPPSPQPNQNQAASAAASSNAETADFTKESMAMKLPDAEDDGQEW